MAGFENLGDLIRRDPCQPSAVSVPPRRPDLLCRISPYLLRCEVTLLAPFCRANRTDWCPVSGVKQPCRRNP